MRKSIIGILCGISIAIISSPLYAAKTSNGKVINPTTWEEKAQWCKSHAKKCDAKHHRHHKHHGHKHHGHKHHHHKHHGHKHHHKHHAHKHTHGTVHEQDSYCKKHPSQCAKEREYNEDTRNHR